MVTVTEVYELIRDVTESGTVDLEVEIDELRGFLQDALQLLGDGRMPEMAKRVVERLEDAVDGDSVRGMFYPSLDDGLLEKARHLAGS